jgi:predicted GNAT family acetyltransferase
MVKPAYEEFISQGRISTADPEGIFFELAMRDFTPFTSPDAVIRPITEHDVDEAARLTRLIHLLPFEDPITEEERLKVKACEIIFCLEIEGKIVAVASSNGLAIKAFQILGVATHPDFQRKGYAKAVCSHLIRYMQTKGATKAIIFTGEENVAARKCYLDLGFRITDRYYVGIFQAIHC